MIIKLGLAALLTLVVGSLTVSVYTTIPISPWLVLYVTVMFGSLTGLVTWMITDYARNG